LTFDLPPVSGKGKQEIVLQVRPAQLGEVTVTAEAVTADGLQANTSAVTRIEKGKLSLHIEPPAVAIVGERIPIRIAATNGGAAAAENVTVWVTLDPGLAPLSGAAPVELSGGTLAAGQTKTFDLPLSAKAGGKYMLRATATADGNLTASADPVTVEVRRADLAVTVNGPQLVYLNQQVDWMIAVANRGDSAVANVAVRATVPSELKLTAADGGTIGAGVVEWKLNSLASGEQKSFKLSGEAIKLASPASLAIAVAGDLGGSGAATTPVSGKATAAVEIIGSPALSLELATPPGVIEVGKRMSYQIRVKNQGTVLAQNIEVTALAPPELKPVRGSSGAANASIDSTGRIAFPTVAELPPGQTLTFTVEADAIKSGDARFSAEVNAVHLKATLKEEQSTRITGK
jgi:uncharacterized repeat protein (TIGR01451 family)